MYDTGRRWLVNAVAAVTLMALATTAYAQTSSTAKPAAKPATGAKTAAPATATGGAFGTVVGRVMHGAEPLGFANVIVLGTRQGTATDENGNYKIVGVPVGQIQVKVQAVGYDAITQSASINAGAVTTVNFTIGEAKVVKEFEIETKAEKKIDTKSSATKQTITGDKLREIPVDNLKDAVGLKAGIVASSDGLHFRGGRAGEVKWQFDGVEATDALTGRDAGIANLAVASTEVISGGFDAEYGNALSGVVAVQTREGTEKFGGEVRWDTDRYGDPTKTYDNFDRFQIGFGGPTPIKNLTYFATYEGTWTDTYLRTSRTEPTATLWDFITIGNRQFNQINTNFKLAYRANSSNKVTFEVINNRTIDTPYNHMWSRKGFVQVTYDTVRTAGQPNQYRPHYGTWSATQVDSTYQAMNMPDHTPTTDDRYQSFTGVWTSQMSPKTVLTTRLSRIGFSDVTAVGNKSPWDYDTQSPFYWSGNTVPGTEDNPFFATHGDYPTPYVQQSSSTWTLKTDYSSRQWKAHSFKTGVEARYNYVQNLSLTLPNSEANGLPGGTRSDFTNYNPEGSAYVQDRWEYEGLVLNAGLRYDLFTPGYQIPLGDLPSGKRYKTQFSPRLGIAYPISDKDVLSFHYGWTYQTPQRAFIFENRGINSAVNVRGNPDLEPETNIAYQAGVQHLFSKDVSGQFSVFFKDIYGLLTVRQERDEFGNLVNVWFNGDYASARGFEASLIKSFSHKFSAEVNYTFQLATGVASDPNQALQFFNGGRLYLPISEQPLAWDQRNTLTLQGVVRDPGKWGVRMLWSYGSGFPFTPTFRNDRKPDPALENSRRLPSNSNLTVDGDKYFRIWGQNVTLFFDARNVMNTKNINTLSYTIFPNPNVGQSGDEYLIYYTETGRAGGAYLADVNGDGVLDWVGVNDPRVFQEGRYVRMGVSVTF
jgi:outer membrane receptor protein involved in Fe transport